MVRHPAAFASSLKRLNWLFDFQDLLGQPLLMRDQLEPYRRAMESIKPDDVIGQAALLWTLIYRSVHATRETNPDFIIVRHEDLSRDPIPVYREMYKTLGLEYTARVEKFILNSSSSENPKESSKVHNFKLDSRGVIEGWKKRMTPEEIARVHDLTREVSPLYYSDAEW
jgi:hypothetical protein